MKKTAICLCALLLFAASLCPTIVLANSAPLNDEGTQSSEIFTLDENSPIVVDSEELVFDYRALQESSSRGGTVTASYQMRNPTNKTQTVKMAFPYINSPYYVHAADIGIMCDGEYLPWQHHRSEESILRRDLNQDFIAEQLNIENILTMVNKTQQPYVPANLDLQAEGILYHFTNLTSHGIYIEMDKEYVSQNIFNQMSENTGIEPNLFWSYYEATECDIFSLNGPIEYNLTGSCTETITTMTLQEYLEEFRGEFWMSHGHSIEGLRTYWLQQLDKSLAYPSAHTRGELYSQNDDSIYIDLLVYEVPFEPNETRTVSISYPSFLNLSGVYGEEYYEEVYLLNPAKHWSEFGALEITIYMPSFAPNLLQSSVDFIEKEPGTYSAYLNELPQKDLTFTFSFQDRFPFPFGFWILIGLLVLAVLYIFVSTVDWFLNRKKYTA